MNATTSGDDIYDSAAAVSEAGSESGRQGLKETLQTEGRGLVTDAKAEVRRMADQRKHEAASMLRDVADAIGQATSTLNDKGYGRVAHYAEAAADRLKKVGDDLPDRDLDYVLGQVTGFARERPALFLGGMFLAGFGAARFLATSAPRGNARTGSYDPYRSAAGSDGYVS